MLEEQLCTHQVNHTGASRTENSRQRLKEKRMPPLAAAKSE
jgi:hypothetical protein